MRIPRTTAWLWVADDGMNFLISLQLINTLVIETDGQESCLRVNESGHKMEEYM